MLQTPLPLDVLDPKKVPVEFKEEHDHWLAVYNPEIPRALEVELMRTLTHDRCRFFVSTKYLLGH
jgi:hypothetical protein